MNLQEIRNKVSSLIDYGAQTSNQTYKDEMDEFINSSYKWIYSSEKWDFRKEQTFIDIEPDLNYSGTLANASVTDGMRGVSFSTSIRELDDPFRWEGQYIEIDGRDYKIQKVTGVTGLRLAEPYRGTTQTDNTNWILKHPHYYLPADAAEIVSVEQVDEPFTTSATSNGRLIPLSHEAESWSSARKDETANFAQHIFFKPSQVIPPGEVLVTAATASVGDIASGVTMEFCYAFVGEGNTIGGFSDTETITTTQGNTGFKLQTYTYDGETAVSPTWSGAYDTYPNPYEGLRKIFFFNQNWNRLTGERLGLPCWRLVTEASGSQGFATEGGHKPLYVEDTQSQAVVDYKAAINPGNARWEPGDGTRILVKPWPRIIGYDATYNYSGSVAGVTPETEARKFRRLKVTYYKKPTTLCLASDVPQLPYQWHELLVWKTVESLLMKLGNSSQAQTFRTWFERDFEKMKQKEITKRGELWRRGQFDNPFGSFYRSRFDASSLQKLN